MRGSQKMMMRTCKSQDESMKTTNPNEPLSAREFDQLREFLSQVKRRRALSLEAMDGLFCALIAGAHWVEPGEYLPLLWGGSLPDEIVMFKVPNVNAMVSLLTRHWNVILAQFDAGATHSLPLARDGADESPGRAWAEGFMRGVNFVPGGWTEFLQGESRGEFERITGLANGIDPSVPRDQPRDFRVEELFTWVAAAYRHFHDRRNTDRLTIELAADVEN